MSLAATDTAPGPQVHRMTGFLSGHRLRELQRDAAHLLPDHAELRLDPASYRDLLRTGVHTVRLPAGRAGVEELAASRELARLAEAVAGVRTVRVHDAYLVGVYPDLVPAAPSRGTAASRDVVAVLVDLADGTLVAGPALAGAAPTPASGTVLAASVVVEYVAC